MLSFPGCQAFQYAVYTHAYLRTHTLLVFIYLHLLLGMNLCMDCRIHAYEGMCVRMDVLA